MPANNKQVAPAGYFVWVRGLREPQPQKWAQMDYGIGNWKKYQILAYHPLSDEEQRLSLNELAKHYPITAVSD
jgi:hypothetical protein